MADDGMKVYIDGQEFAFDDFSLGDLEYFQDELGSLDEELLTSPKGIARMVVAIKRREDPSYTLEQAHAIKLSAMQPPATEKKKRPTRAAKAAPSAPAESGETS